MFNCIKLVLLILQLIHTFSFLFIALETNNREDVDNHLLLLGSIKMVFKGRIPDKIRAYIKYHQQDIIHYGRENLKIIEILFAECNISRRSVYRLLKEPITQPRSPQCVGADRWNLVALPCEAVTFRDDWPVSYIPP